MDAITLSRLGLKHVKNHMAEEIYLYTGLDFTRPVIFNAIVNEHCNAKCSYCHYWRLKHYRDEMSIEEWQRALRGIQDFVGAFSISFSGGEPFIKPGLLDLMVWCRDNGIRSGVTTNGSALTSKNAARLVEARPFNVNVSVDAPEAALHDELRGWPGLFELLCAGIETLRNEQERRGIQFPIIIKPTIMSKNFRTMPDMVPWAKAIGATCLHYQPLQRSTPETYGELWIDTPDHADFEAMIDALIRLKRQGEPIFNTEATFRLFINHFREEKSPDAKQRCRVGLQNFSIRTNGDVEPGYGFPRIGNIKEQDARDIWHGALARKVRQQSVNSRQLIVNAAASPKSLGDKVKMGLTLLRN